MAKKDTADAVLGMLSTTGASTRPTRTPPAEPATIADQPGPAHIDAAATEELAPVVSAASASRRRSTAAPTPTPVAPTAPRTLRLRASTAAALRDAWLAAKRDDVLLSHQDFASDLLDAALHHRTTSR